MPAKGNGSGSTCLPDFHNPAAKLLEAWPLNVLLSSMATVVSGWVLCHLTFSTIPVSVAVLLDLGLQLPGLVLR